MNNWINIIKTKQYHSYNNIYHWFSKIPANQLFFGRERLGILSLQYFSRISPEFVPSWSATMDFQNGKRSNVRLHSLKFSQQKHLWTGRPLHICIYKSPKKTGRTNRLVNQWFFGGFTNSLFVGFRKANRLTHKTESNSFPKVSNKCIQEVLLPLAPTIMEASWGNEASWKWNMGSLPRFSIYLG